MYERDCVSASVYSLLHVDAFQFTDASKSLALALVFGTFVFSSVFCLSEYESGKTLFSLVSCESSI